VRGPRPPWLTRRRSDAELVGLALALPEVPGGIGLLETGGTLKHLVVEFGLELDI
jgi:hypothetical protein